MPEHVATLDDRIVEHLKQMRDTTGQEYAFPVVFEAELGASKKDVLAALARLCKDGRVKAENQPYPDISPTTKCYGLPGAGKPTLFVQKRR